MSFWPLDKLQPALPSGDMYSQAAPEQAPACIMAMDHVIVAQNCTLA